MFERLRYGKFLWLKAQAGTPLQWLPRRIGGQESYSCFRFLEPTDEKIRNLSKEGDLSRALDGLLRMEQEGLVPSVDLYRTLLKECTKRKSLVHARRLHTYLVRHGLEATRFLGESVVNSFVKCGGLEYALNVFQRLPSKSVVSWTAVMSGYVQAGKYFEALRLFRCMEEDGVRPNSYTFATLLKACASIPDLDQGRRIHVEIARYDLERDLIVSTCLIYMYAQCLSLPEAQIVFDGLRQKDLVLWNAMLAGYAQQGQGGNALLLYHDMQEEGWSPGCRTFVSILQGCCSLADAEDICLTDGQFIKTESLQKVKVIHAEVQRRGCVPDTFVGNALLVIYGKCGSFLDMQNVFDALLHRDVVSWNSMLTALVQQGQANNALLFYEQMAEQSVDPDDRSFVSVIQACRALADNESDVILGGQPLKLESLQQGKALHAEARRRGHISDAFVGNSLVSLYAKCGSIRDAQSEFERLLHRDIVSWNSMLAAHVQQGDGEQALLLYRCLSLEGVSPDERTLVSALQACANIAEMETSVIASAQSVKLESLRIAKAMQSEAWRRGYKSDMFVGSALINLFGKCGSILDAECVFKGLPQHNVVTWTAMLTAYAQQELGEKALQLYGQMLSQGLSPNDTTIVSVLQACGQTGALDLCVKIHRNIFSTREDMSLIVATALITAYGYCARMKDAQGTIEALRRTDVIIWNALLAGYVRQGDSEMSFQCYDKMQIQGVQPNSATFLLLLSVCSHAGLVDKGVDYFEAMCKVHGITPVTEHYACMVDLLGRAGKFAMLEHLLGQMLVEPDLSTWLCLLGACRMHGNIALGRHAFDKAVQLVPTCSAPYVMMSNLYVHAGLWDCAKEVDWFRQKAGAWKKPGQSWIQHEQEVHAFGVGVCKHQQNEVLDLLAELRICLKKRDSILPLRIYKLPG